MSNLFVYLQYVQYVQYISCLCLFFFFTVCCSCSLGAGKDTFRISTCRHDLAVEGHLKTAGAPWREDKSNASWLARSPYLGNEAAHRMVSNWWLLGLISVFFICLFSTFYITPRKQTGNFSEDMSVKQLGQQQRLHRRCPCSKPGHSPLFRCPIRSARRRARDWPGSLATWEGRLPQHQKFDHEKSVDHKTAGK